MGGRGGETRDGGRELNDTYSVCEVRTTCECYVRQKAQAACRGEAAAAAEGVDAWRQCHVQTRGDGDAERGC